jgi:glycosyltransferase involved in cell wall biosynthesis
VLALPLKPQIIAVSDGSTDGTNEIIRTYQRERGITGVICPVNGGKGAAIQAGLAHATGPYTVIQDADLEYSPEQFDVLLEPVRQGRATVVYGSRNLRHPAMRKNNFHYMRFWLGGKVVSLACNYLFGVHLTDEATCYKLFPTDLLRRMNLRCRGFDFCPEVTAKALRMGYRIHEVPIEYNPRTLAEGKKIRAWHGIEAILVLAKFRVMPMSLLLNTPVACPAPVSSPATAPQHERAQRAFTPG